MKWEECNGDINEGWNLTDVNAPMMPIYEFLINNADLNIMVNTLQKHPIYTTHNTHVLYSFRVKNFDINT